MEIAERRDDLPRHGERRWAKPRSSRKLDGDFGQLARTGRRSSPARGEPRGGDHAFARTTKEGNSHRLSYAMAVFPTSTSYGWCPFLTTPSISRLEEVRGRVARPAVEAKLELAQVLLEVLA